MAPKRKTKKRRKSTKKTKLLNELKSKMFSKKKGDDCDYFYECKSNCCVDYECSAKNKCQVPKNLRDLYVPTSDYMKASKLYYRGNAVDVLFSMLYLIKKYPKKLKFATITESILKKKRLKLDDFHIKWTMNTNNERFLKYKPKLINEAIENFKKDTKQKILVIPILLKYETFTHSNYLIIIKLNKEIIAEVFDPMGDIAFKNDKKDTKLLFKRINKLLKQHKLKIKSGVLKLFLNFHSYQGLSYNIYRKNNVYYCNIWCIWYIEMLIEYLSKYESILELNRKILKIINTKEKSYMTILNFSSKVSKLNYQFLKYIYEKYNKIFNKYEINTYKIFLNKHIVKIKLILNKNKIKLDKERVDFFSTIPF